MLKITAKVKGITQPVDSEGLELPEDIVAYCARVSNPGNQLNPKYEKLFDYCIKNNHWSIFEMVNALVEVEAPRDISRQLLRHRSFSFQEFSQRYSDEIEFTQRDFRRQDDKNRQNSFDDLDEDVAKYCDKFQSDLVSAISLAYKEMRQDGVAKECARVVLPEGLTMSRLYVNGTLRSWLHYLDVRDDEGVTQWEHVLLAREIKDALLPHFSKVFAAVAGAKDERELFEEWKRGQEK